MTAAGYFAPHSIQDAVAALAAAGGQARVLAGGTDLLVQMRTARARPQTIVDIKKIPEACGITERDGSVFIGAAVCGADLSRHVRVRALWPGLAEAMDLIGSQQIQGRASPGGNLCNASPAADSVPALIAAGAVAIIVGPTGAREVKVEEVVTGPGRTVLKTDEFVLCFKLPVPPVRTGDAYLRLTPRTEMDIAIVGAAASVTMDTDGRCSAARIALGAVAPTPLLVTEAAHAILGTPLDEPALAKLETAARAVCRPIDDKRGTIAYRTQVAGVLARRAVRTAAERAQSQ
ncbi:MAG: FAD binding domain-containing protein [Alphaproteobacteria bacterium]